MLNDLSLWIKQIIIVIIFATFIDFLLPSGGFRRYSKALLGLVIMITILNPLLVLINKNFVLEEVIWQYQGLIENDEIIMRAEDFNEKNHQLLIEQYKKRISDLVTKTVAGNSSYKAKKVDVKIIEDRSVDNFGAIKELYIWLDNNNQDKRLENIQKVTVTVRINDDGYYGKYSDTDTSGFKAQELQRLKQILARELEIEINKIYFN